MATSVSNNESQTPIIGQGKEVAVVATRSMISHVADSNVPALEVRRLFRHEVMLKRSDPLHFLLNGPVVGCFLV
jgi:hypothetical protein